MKATGQKPKQGGANLGTFAGVFTPSVLTILGIILFLRLGYVVGNAGLLRALLIIGIANLISVLTSFSLSAIATNLKVRGGGDYYLISRTLGVEFGGAIGIVLFLAQSVSIAFYSIGFAEAFVGFTPATWPLHPQLVAAAAIAMLFVLAWLGADWATRFQYVVMATLVAALVSFIGGGLARWDGAVLSASLAAPEGALPFWAVFAIFFPAVTGFTQGVSMSGDLRDPGRSLPLGTFLAVGISIVAYFGAAILFAATVPLHTLMADYSAMKGVAAFAPLVDAGVVAATLSSAMASFLGAPRILQSLAADRTFPILLPFAKGTGPAGNPRRGVLLAAGIALAVVALGNLNLVARIVSMFFLISYGLLNYATFFEARGQSPSFRPRFRWYHFRLSQVGAALCLGCMLALDVSAGVAALAVLTALYQYLKRSAGPARWADSRRSYHLQEVRTHLLAAAREPEHPRDWRPQILAFSKDSDRRAQLLKFASWLEGGSGLTTAVLVLEGDDAQTLRQQSQDLEDLRKELESHHLTAFPLVVTVPHLRAGVSTLVQAYGVGSMKANTVLLNWLDTTAVAARAAGERRYGRNLGAALRHGCNLVVLAVDDEDLSALQSVPPKERVIDLWWRPDATGRLMLLLAYLTTRDPEWDDAAIRVLAAKGKDGAEATRVELLSILEEARIEAEPVVVDGESAEDYLDVSKESSLVFLPLRLKAYRPLGPFGEPIEDLLPSLPMAALVLAATEIDLDAAPEEGQAGETAATMDAVAETAERAAAAEQEAAAAAERTAEAQRRLEDLAAAGVNEEEIAQAEQEVHAAQEDAKKTARRAAKAVAKHGHAQERARELGLDVGEEDLPEEQETPDP